MTIGAIIKVSGSADADLPVSSIEVTEKLGESTRFRLRLPVTIGKGGDLPILSDARLDPGSEIAILVEVGGDRHCLVKGLVHAHDIHLENGGEGSHVDVRGADRMVEMNRESKAVVWPDGSASDAVSAICGPYGLTLDVDTTKAVFSRSKHALVQRETDLAFVRRLARHNGCLFWITCDADGVETAHFRRPDLTAEPAVEIAINQGDPNDPVDIAFDVERPSSANLAQHDFAAKAVILADVEEQPLPLLGKVALKGVQTGDHPVNVHIAAPSDSSADLTARAEAALIEASFFVRAETRATAATLGKVARAHTVVTLGGVGRRHNGKYLCAGVTHTIDADAHAMAIELIRNSWET